MRKLLLVLLFFLLPCFGRAEEAVDETIDSLDLSSWQAAVDEAGAELDVVQIVRVLAQGEMEFTPEAFMDLLREMILGEADGFYGQLLAFMGPALLWAVNRYLLSGGKLGEATGYVCFLAGAGVMLGAFASQMELARTTVRRMGNLTEQVFPVIVGLMSASGSPGAGSAVQAMVAFAGGAMSAFLEKAIAVMCGGAAVLAAADNLTERIRLGGLFRLCRSVGNWLFGGIMAAFLGMTTLSGLLGGAQDGVTIRAAKYAVDNLLPVVGGDVADAMDGMVRSAMLVRSAAGVTGVIVMLSVCLRPVLRLALGMLTCRLAAALTEPVAEGPLSRCMEQLGQATQMLLTAVSVSAALFITLTGVCLTAG